MSKNSLLTQRTLEISQLTWEIGVSSISEKGRVTIPKEIRDMLNLQVVFFEKDNEFVVHKGRSKKVVCSSWESKALGTEHSGFSKKGQERMAEQIIRAHTIDTSIFTSVIKKQEWNYND